MFLCEFVSLSVVLFRKRKSVSDDEVAGVGPKRVKIEAVTEDHVTSEVNEVAPDSEELSAANCPIKLEEVHSPVEEEDPLYTDHGAQPEAAVESPEEGVNFDDCPTAFNFDVCNDLDESSSTPPEISSTAPQRRGTRAKTIDEWKADPTVVSVTEEGLPPGWTKIVKRPQGGNKRVFFKSSTRNCMQ